MSYPLSFYYIDDLEFPTPEVKELREARPSDRIYLNFAGDILWLNAVTKALNNAASLGVQFAGFKAVTGKYYLVSFSVNLNAYGENTPVLVLKQVADEAWELGKDPVVIELLKEVYA